MLLDLAAWAVAFGAGLALQRSARVGDLNRWLWHGFFWTVSPTLVVFSYSTLEVGRGLVLVIVAVITSTYLVLGLSLLLVRLLARTRDERGALALAGAVPNTS